MAQYPPAAAAAVPEAMDSSSSPARRAQVHVRIDEGGSEQQPVAVDDAMGVGVEIRSECGDDAVVDANVEHSIDCRARVEHARAAHDDVLAGSVLREQHHATPSTDSVLTSTGPLVSRS